MKEFSEFSRRVFAEESGQDMIEYALVAALVGLGAIASIKGVATNIANAFTHVGSSLTANV